MNPMIVKLTNGDELLGEIEMSGDAVHIKDPAIIILQKDGLALYRYLPYADISEKGIAVKEDKILYVVLPDSQLAENHARWHEDIIVNQLDRIQQPETVEAEEEEPGLQLVTP
jgi:hypothetical protein